MNRRTGDILNECIKAIENKEKTIKDCLSDYSEVRHELEPMLVAVAKLVGAGRIMPDAERKQQGRAKLLEAVEQKHWELGVGGGIVPGRSGRAYRWRTMLMRVGVVAVIFSMLGGTTMALARVSLPGSPLYPVKIAAENAIIGLTVDKGKKSKLYLNAARERISELGRIKESSRHYQDLLRVTAENIAQANVFSGEGHSKEFEDALGDIAKTNKDVLEDVLEKAPSSAKPALQRALINVYKSKNNRIKNGDKENKHGIKEENNVNRPAGNHNSSEVKRGNTRKPAAPSTVQPLNNNEVPNNYYNNKNGDGNQINEGSSNEDSPIRNMDNPPKIQ